MTIAYEYKSTSLANGDDEILLFDPGGQEKDRVTWSDSGSNEVKAGASLERTIFYAPDDPWVTAATPWPGSAGDLGSPGQAYGAPLPPTATPTETSTETPTPEESPTPMATPAPAPRIFISEFLANPDAVNDSEGEWS